ncbi:hypothetical protein [Streptomyces sp. H27-C3]|uniref:hypothetical protein n=1 Tax=Streptomyces sp. H27-C3 TaxID=3046305 RepID=UPI0024BBCBB5|nr:hypothetical protein [Streptomyces sp. H27-C3]MDJ0461833.1 hypothetical protein [Streptomyces sp. H27-C3]
MAPDGWTQAVRERLGLGRLLPLGGAADGAWLAERAAVAVLRGAAASVTGVGLGTLRIALSDPESAGTPAVPPPPSALPPGPLRIEADFAATADEPLPQAAGRLREALLATASDRLGLAIAEVDLRVTGLLDAAPLSKDATGPTGGNDAGPPGPDGPRERAAAAAVSVPGVLRLTSNLGAPVHLADGHVRVELATAADHRALDVALAVRAAVAKSQDGHPTVAVLVTGIGQ